MALDTYLKRLSAMEIMCPWRRVLPPPDGTLDIADRTVLLLLCAAQPAQTTVITFPVFAEGGILETVDVIR
jgi:hypothetical protein